MKHVLVIAGLCIYMLLLKVVPIAMMTLFGLVAFAFLVFIFWAFLSSTPGSSSGTHAWEPKDIDARD